jgi:hypothetical protein
MTTLDQNRLLRALATLQSGRLSQATPSGEVLVFAEEWQRAFSPEVLALLDAYYQASRL